MLPIVSALGEPARSPVLAAELVALQRASYRVEADLIGTDRIPPLHETAEELAASGSTWFGARDDDGLLGAVRVRPGPPLDIEGLVVHPRAFRRGVGSALVRHVLDRAGGPVTVATGRANTPARVLYERLGFTLLDYVEVEPGLQIARYARSVEAGADRRDPQR